MIWLGLLGGVVVLLLANVIYLSWYFHWESRNTSGLAYYGRSLAGRRALAARMRWRSAPIKPFVWLLARVLPRSRATMPSFDFEGTAGPTKVSSQEIFRRAQAYQPHPEDVFVATQMRSGTTWMQQIVYETLSRGRGTIGDNGQGHLYAMSPWIDGANSVSMEDAPLVGTPPSRIIKTHLPASLCPYSPAARYVYVARHPVACFASIVDFERSLSGPLALSVPALADWFCGDRMYWQPWPRHVDGWWRWSESRDNVLFVHFEDMKRDFDAVLGRVARLLGCKLTPEERARIRERCSFAYMSTHHEFFEMSPPTMFSVSGRRFLAGGKSARHADVPPDVRERILTYCRGELRGARYPAARFYPDLAN